ncbi:hypothetical protein [Exiguobacterium sp. s21]|uniref:hypothetical protein n=1 Tax=Exiguobacterium sp. s21 TaxID=2751244 RepID=UPI001BE70E48|nr:hypothetical protein [Exiguobacterium sp. s21]
MLETDVFDEILDGITDEVEERADITTGYGPRVWGVDWSNGRLYKAQPERTPLERVVKYLLTPRGQVEVYPQAGGFFDEGYGSLIWTLYGETFVSNEEAQSAFQAICDELPAKLDGIERVVAENTRIDGDRVYTTIRVVTDNGEELTANDIDVTE